MGYQPWGPHGPQGSPHEVMPNPTAPSAPVPQFGDSAYPASPSYAGGGAGGSGLLANFVLSLMMVVILWIPTVCLYPLTALSGIAAGLGTAPVFARMIPDANVAALLSVAVGLLAVVIVIRIEYRLARIRVYRVTRHVVRLVLLAVVAIPMIMLAKGAPFEGTTTRFILGVVSSPRIMAGFLANATNIGILLVVVGVLHFLLWKGERLSRFWHRRLSMIGLK